MPQVVRKKRGLIKTLGLALVGLIGVFVVVVVVGVIVIAFATKPNSAHAFQQMDDLISALGVRTNGTQQSYSRTNPNGPLDSPSVDIVVLKEAPQSAVNTDMKSRLAALGYSQDGTDYSHGGEIGGRWLALSRGYEGMVVDYGVTNQGSMSVLSVDMSPN